MTTDDNPGYVTQQAWLRPAGRADAIDEIADSIERPAPVSGAEAFWSPAPVLRWPEHGDRHGADRLRPALRRAG